jgi:hypothetical protein
MALPILELSTKRGWVVSTTLWPLYPRKDPVPIVQDARWAPGPVWTCVKNLAPTGIQPPDHPAHSQSLYQLSYLAHFSHINITQKCVERYMFYEVLILKTKECSTVNWENIPWDRHINL